MSRTDRRDFYVSLVRDGRTALLAGPFTEHTDALANVDPAYREACSVDPWCDFDARGTCSLPYAPTNPYGKLNRRLGIVPRAPLGALEP